MRSPALKESQIKKVNAVFFDRDGTIMHDAHYPRHPDQVRLLPGAGEALMALKRKGMLLVLISNQSGIGRGLITPEQAEAVHEKVMNCLSQFEVCLDGAYYCPHAPEEKCSCRKPLPEMVLRAAHDLDIDLSSSYMVGDKESDIEAGKRAGCRTILIEHGEKPASLRVAAGYRADNWREILDYILLDAGTKNLSEKTVATRTGFEKK
jgi:D-glycero-D-manno-heptose 1,7-bisphosphate phosphatase